MSEIEKDMIEKIRQVFLVECALRELSSDKIESMIYKIESIIPHRLKEIKRDRIWYEKNEERLKAKDIKYYE